MLKGESRLDVVVGEKDKKMLFKNSRNKIFLSLVGNVLSPISKEKTTTGLWRKFESYIWQNL